jgi:hypothetical protein
MPYKLEVSAHAVGPGPEGNSRHLERANDCSGLHPALCVLSNA